MHSFRYDERLRDVEREGNRIMHVIKVRLALAALAKDRPQRPSPCEVVCAEVVQVVAHLAQQDQEAMSARLSWRTIARLWRLSQPHLRWPTWMEDLVAGMDVHPSCSRRRASCSFLCSFSICVELSARREGMVIDQRAGSLCLRHRCHLTRAICHFGETARRSRL
jgi:hypothetical protein